MFTKKEVDFIQDRACERITEILDALGIDYTEQSDYIQMPCPVHGGDNDRAVYWAVRTKHWVCKTRECHKDKITGPSSSIFGLVRGVMSRKTESDWSFQQAIDFIARILGLRGLALPDESAEEIEIRKLLKSAKQQKKNKNNWPLLSEVLPKLEPDTTYYPARGIPKEIIEKYHISICKESNKPFTGRAFIPLLDESGKFVLGWSGRSIYEKCQKCNSYHNPQKQCPKVSYPKWKHSKNAKLDNVLYNIWYAKRYIAKVKTAILCEGPADVWKYELSGIHNSVAILGLNISRQQRMILQNAGALTVIISLDNDEAGIIATERLREQLNAYFRVISVKPTEKDIDMMDKEEILKLVGGKINVR